MVELLIFIVGMAALITFWSSFKAAGNAISGSVNLATNAVATINETADDSLKTYAIDVSILNARKRKEQEAEIATLAAGGKILSVEELKAKLGTIQEEV